MLPASVSIVSFSKSEPVISISPASVSRLDDPIVAFSSVTFPASLSTVKLSKDRSLTPIFPASTVIVPSLSSAFSGTVISIYGFKSSCSIASAISSS